MGLFFDDMYPWEQDFDDDFDDDQHDWYHDEYHDEDHDEYLGACDDVDFETFEREFEENYLDSGLAAIIDPERNPHIKKSPKKKPFGIEVRNSPTVRRIFDGEEWRVHKWYATEKARDTAWEEVKKRVAGWAQSLHGLHSPTMDDYRKCER